MKVCPEVDNARHAKEENPFNEKSSSLIQLQIQTWIFFQSDPFVGSKPFHDPFGKTDPFGDDPFKSSDPLHLTVFFKQSSTDPFATSDTDSFGAPRNSNNALMESLKHK